LVRSLKRELGEDDAELDEDLEDTLSRRVRKECKKRVKIYEDCLKRAQADEQIQAALLEQTRKELADVRDMADDAQRGAVPCLMSRSVLSRIFSDCKMMSIEQTVLLKGCGQSK
jgi:hypothetical protein